MLRKEVDFFDRKNYITNNVTASDHSREINEGAKHYDKMRSRLNEINSTSNVTLESSTTARNNIISSSASTGGDIHYYGTSDMINARDVIQNKEKSTSTLPNQNKLASMRELNNNRL